MNNSMKSLWLAIILLFVSALGAVNGFGDGGTSGSGAGRIQAMLQRFASIVVGDVELDTGSALVRVNGTPALVSDLKVGYQLNTTIEPLPTGRTEATQVTYDSTLIGTVSRVDPLTQSVRVLGQHVLFAAHTNLDNLDPDSIQRGDWIEISGQRKADRSIVASYAGRLLVPPPTVILTGRVDAIVPGGLAVDGVAIDTTTAQGPQPSLGETIIIHGAPLPGGAVSASLLRSPSGVEPAALAHFHVEGFVDDTTSLGFRLNGINVQVLPQTTMINGVAEHLAAGVRLETGGDVINGEIQADTIYFKPELRQEVSGQLEAVDFINTDSAFLQVAGFRILFNQGSDFGRSDSARRNVTSLHDLIAGHDYLRVRGYVDGLYSAVRRLDRVKTNDQTRLEGVINTVSDGQIFVMGKALEYDEDTTIKFDGDPVPAGRLVQLVVPGDVVKARWDNPLAAGPAKRITVERTIE